jgi:glutamine amidotransferase-like uncharacterized protein
MLNSSMMSKVAIFLNHPECSVDCVNGTTRALSANYQIQIFGKSDLDKVDFFNGIDVVAFPGGIGDSDSYPDFFTRRQANKIADFIQNGGHYLGICMGAYWAGSRYFDLLDGVDATQYIKRPNTDIRRSYSTTAPVTWQGQKEDMFFYDGCALIGDESKFSTVARYANADPMAIIQGRVGIIGCHPESEQYWYEAPRQYINSKWHQGRHHALLLEFVNLLCNKQWSC